MELSDLKKGDRFTMTVSGIVRNVPQKDSNFAAVVSLDEGSDATANWISKRAQISDLKLVLPHPAVGDGLYVGHDGNARYTIVGLFEGMWITRLRDGTGNDLPRLYSSEIFKDYIRKPKQEA